MQTLLLYCDKLTPSLRRLAIGDGLIVPTKFYSLATVKVTAARMKHREGLTFTTDSLADSRATIVTRKA